MINYQTILFWFGGVLSQAIAEATLQYVFPNNSFIGKLNERNQIKQLADDLTLGLLSQKEYCQKVIECSNLDITSQALETEILKACLLREPLITLMNELSPSFDLWMISDYPSAWFEDILLKEPLLNQIVGNRIIFVPELKLKRMVPDIFYHVTQRADSQMNECLVVDGVSARAVEAVKHGLQTTIYVYQERLEHELALRKILKLGEVLHPTASQRISR